MDRKGIFILVISFVLLLGWYPFVNLYLYPPKAGQERARTNQVTRSTNRPSQNPMSPRAPDQPVPSATPSMEATYPMPELSDASPEEMLQWQNDIIRYHFTSRGGGIKTIELKTYPLTPSCRDQDSGRDQAYVTLNARGPIPTLTLLGTGALANDGVFKLSRTAHGIRAEKALTNGLYIVKEFIPGTNFLLQAKITIENRSQSARDVPPYELALGTAAALTPQEQSLYIGLQYHGGEKARRINGRWFANRPLGCLPGTPRTVFRSQEPTVQWAAVHTQFFTLAMYPTEPASQLRAHQIQVPPLATPKGRGRGRAPSRSTNLGYDAALVFDGTTLQPGASVERDLYLFAGPKEYKTLARLSARFKNGFEAIMGFGGFFGFFAKALLLSMNGLHSLGLAYGLTIVLITFIIKAIFWPLTQASTRSMKRMGALQPQMKALQEKYKEDPKKMNRKLMEFMRENKVSPLGGCLPILLQLPVFFGFYTMLRSAIELRGASFLWTCDLSKPDTLFLIPGLGIPFNLWPLLMGGAQLWQARMTPVSPGMDPTQQKIMKYMPLMFVAILYNFSAGLALYWTVQNLLSILQMKLTKNVPIAPPTVPPGKHSPVPVKKKKRRKH